MSGIGIADYDSMIDCQSIVFLSLLRHCCLFPSLRYRTNDTTKEYISRTHSLL